MVTMNKNKRTNKETEKVGGRDYAKRKTRPRRKTSRYRMPVVGGKNKVKTLKG